MDWMDRPKELEKLAAMCLVRGEAVQPSYRPFFKAMAAFDEDVFDLLWTTFNFSQCADDLLDEGGLSLDEKMVFLSTLSDSVKGAILDNWQMPGFEFALSYQNAIEKLKWTDADKELCFRTQYQFFRMLGRNKFVQSHPHEICAMLVQMTLRCLAGDEMAASLDEEKRRLAPAVRCSDIDFFRFVIYLHRGWGAASAWTDIFCYDLPDGALKGEG